MKLFDTALLTEETLKQLSPDAVSNIYNGLDCCVTLEIYENLMAELEQEPECVRATYNDALAKQAPFMEMSMRGIRVDSEAKNKSILELSEILRGLDQKFQRIMREIFGGELNWNSPVQVKNLMYGMLGLKEIKKRNSKGVYAATADEAALTQLMGNFWAEPLCRFILAMKEIKKKISFLQTGIDPDGRFRTSLNIAGTDTGRSSSSGSDFGTGSNLQNVDRTLRYPFIADDGMILVNVDLEQADARNLGAVIWNMFLDEYGPEEAGKFLDFAESGDLHTKVCRMAWQELPWPEDESKWKSVAKTPFLGDDSYRDMAKKLGHGSNYLGTPLTMSKHTKTPVKIIESFQQRYFQLFPLIPKWHQRRILEIKQTGVLTTMYGRRRHFFGRGDDAATHRKAIAYEPQSMTGHAMDMGILNMWREMPEVQLLIQVHDSILFEVPYRKHEEYINKALPLLRFHYTLKGGRHFSVPLEAKTGWNWGDIKLDKEGRVVGNPHGLRGYKGEADERTRPTYKTRLGDYLK